ncbi:MAG TPA: DinB family protein [Balneolales bacterium]|nr:DinB family protein [Balneolales bacterium]
MIQYFTRLFRYDRWANEKIIDALNNVDPRDEKMDQLMSHIFVIEEMWFERIVNGSSQIRPVDTLSRNLWLDKSQVLSENYRNLLKNVDEIELDRKRTYKNTKGTTHHFPLRDLLGHVINHSTHHRAQIAFRLRELRYEPPATDYIFYLYQL